MLISCEIALLKKNQVKNYLCSRALTNLIVHNEYCQNYQVQCNRLGSRAIWLLSNGTVELNAKKINPSSQPK